MGCMKGLGTVIAMWVFGGAAAKACRTVAFGIGNSSCANWLSTPSNRNEGGIWIMGYWSGRNDENALNHDVGGETDAQGILAEVRKICEERPSITLTKAAGTAYLNMSDH